MTPDVFPNGKLKALAEAAKASPWWPMAYPRRYHAQHGYVPTEVHAACMGIIIHGPPIPSEFANDSLRVTCVTANALMEQHGCQYFWVTKELCESLLMTKEPEGAINETPWPFRAFTLLIPKGVLRTERDGDMAWITVARSGRAPDGHLDLDGDDCLFLYGASFGESGAPRDWTSYLRSDKTAEDACGEQRHTVDPFPEEIAQEMNARFGWAPSEMCGHDLTFNESGVLKAMLRLAMNAAYYMANVTASVEESQRALTRKVRGVAVDEVWYPRWVGKAHRRSVLVTGVPAGNHSSPRMHWRRGHWRNQPVGEGRADRRRTWIQPILVMAHGEAV